MRNNALLFWLGPLLGCLAMGEPCRAAEKAPLAADLTFRAFRADCLRVIDAMKALDASVPGAALAQVKKVLDDKSKTTQARIDAAQKLLDRACIVSVTINPESRVKVARGDWVARLVRDRATFVLVKIVNEAGVTQALKVGGPHIRTKAKAKGQWLDATVVHERPLLPELTGHALEYVVVRLVAREAGRREATLQFDVGQGTQDLGFRAEVPVLFHVVEKVKSDE